MTILSNDYPSNLPRASKVAHGGTANFARAFSSYAVAHGHAWVGILRQDHKTGVTRIRRHSVAGNATYYKAFLPASRIGTLLVREKRVNLREWLAEEIDALGTFMRRVRPDVLFLNGYDIHAWMLLQAASREGIPVVVQHAGIARIEFTLYKHLYTAAGMKMMLEMERDIVGSATIEVFLNAYSRDTFSSVVAPVPASQARIIPLPYLGVFERAPSGQARSPRALAGHVTIGCVARWDRIKNHKALLAVAKEARRLGLPWTFKAVTRIPDTSFNRRFKDAYRKAIEVVEPVRQTELPAFYRSVDAMVLPSIFDVSPTVVMEAALMGKPTLISPGVGWNSEYRAYGMADWIADFSDPARVVETLSTLLKKRLPVRFANMIRTKHAPDAVFAQYLRAFSDAISASRD